MNWNKLVFIYPIGTACIPLNIFFIIESFRFENVLLGVVSSFTLSILAFSSFCMYMAIRTGQLDEIPKLTEVAS